MLIAANGARKLVFANHATKIEEYFCPACKRKVILKRGKKKMSHFSHRPLETCDSFTEGETREHLEGKSLLYNWLAEQYDVVELESYLPEMAQRPDILFVDEEGRSVCLEFQCSYLNPERMLERTKNYQAHGYEVVWIVGQQFAIKGRQLTAHQRLYMQMTRVEQWFYLEFDDQKMQLALKSGFQQVNPRQIIYESKFFSLKDITWKSLFEEVNLLRRPQKIETDLMEVHEYYIQGFRRQNEVFKEVMQMLYRSKLNLQTAHEVLYDTLSEEWWLLGSSLLWKVEVICYLGTLEHGEIISTSELFKHVSFVHIDIYMNPYVSKSLLNRLLLLYMERLEVLGFLQSISANEWILIQRIESYRHEREKLSVLKGL